MGEHSQAQLLTVSEIKLFVVKTCQYVALVVVFVAGVSAADALSLFYVLFATYFLLTFDGLLSRPRNWLVLQSYAFGVLALKLVWQFPWIPASLGATGDLFVKAIGLQKLTLQQVFTPQGVIFDLLIVLVIALLNRLLASGMYLAMLAQQRRFENVSRALLRTMRLKLVNAWVTVFQDQLARYKRLQKLQRIDEMDSWTIWRVQVRDQVIFSETEDESEHKDVGSANRRSLRGAVLQGSTISKDAAAPPLEEADDEPSLRRRDSRPMSPLLDLLRQDEDGTNKPEKDETKSAVGSRLWRDALRAAFESFVQVLFPVCPMIFEALLDFFQSRSVQRDQCFIFQLKLLPYFSQLSPAVYLAIDIIFSALFHSSAGPIPGAWSRTTSPATGCAPSSAASCVSCRSTPTACAISCLLCP
jgi:hypothetical protein